MHLRRATYKFFGRAGFLLLPALLVGMAGGCEDVVDVDTPAEDPRLVVDALIRVDTSQALIPIVITVKETSGFFEQTPVTELEQISIGNEAGAYEVLLENPEESGRYESAVTLPFLRDGGQVILQLQHRDQLYFARTTYMPSVPIDTLIQGDETLFDDDETELVLEFTDSGERNDFYLLDLDLGEYLVTEDEFYQGQSFRFSYFYDRDLQPGQKLTVSLLGVDRTFYNYMSLLIQQGSEPSGPFQTPTAALRGNIFNVTEIDNIDHFDNVELPDNYALGYFAVAQVFQKEITLTE